MGASSTALVKRKRARPRCRSTSTFGSSAWLALSYFAAMCLALASQSAVGSTTLYELLPAPSLGGSASTSAGGLTKHFRRSMGLSDSMSNVGIASSDLATGVYLVEVTSDNHAQGGGHYYERASGIMSWYSSGTNNADCDDVALHHAGHATNGHRLRLRTCRSWGSSGGKLELQMSDSVLSDEQVTVTATNNEAVLGKCDSADDFQPRAFTFQGTYIGISAAHRIVSDSSASFGTSRYIAAHQTSQHCKMVRFTIRRNGDGTCVAQADSARYKNGACDSSDAAYVDKWNAGYISQTLASTNSAGGYGMRSLEITVPAALRALSVGAFTYDFYFTRLIPQLPQSVPSVGGSASTSEDGLTKHFRRSMGLLGSMSNVGIASSDLATGVYLVHILSNNHAQGGGHYYERASGIMSWYSSGTNNADCDDVALHHAGHATNGHRLRLRTCRSWGSSGGKLELQMSDSVLSDEQVTVTATNNEAVLGKCDSADDFQPRAFTFQGTYIGISAAHRIVSDSSASFGTSRYIAAHQTSQHCKMVRFTIRRNGDGTCVAQADSARYKNGACDSSDAAYVDKWNAGYISQTLASTNSAGGYGMRSLEITVPAALRALSVGAFTYDFYFTRLIPQLPQSVPSVGGSASTSEDGLTKHFRRSMGLLGSMSNVGIASSDLATGVYLVHILSNNHAQGGGHYYERASGIMSWYSSGTNNADCDDVALHHAGHATNGHRLRLRTCRSWGSSGGKLELQMSDSVLSDEQVTVTATNNEAVLGKCDSADDFQPRAFTFQGTYIGISAAHRIVSDSSASFGTSRYIAAHQTSQHCKMVRFTIRRNGDGTCVAQADSARYKNGACDSSDAAYVDKWNAGYISQTLASTNSAGGYGMRSLEITVPAALRALSVGAFTYDFYFTRISRFEDVSVSMSDPVSLVSAFSFDFGIKVAHSSCGNDRSDCFEAEVNRDRHRLRCKVEIARRGADCSTYGEHMPCRRWDDFLPQSLEMTDSRGELIDGTYDIKYSCYVVLSDGTHAADRNGDWQTLHTFDLRAGCSDWMPHGRNHNLENVARQLLLTSDEFNVADCRDETQVYKAKETVFRRYDNDPEDGVLSYTEITSALEAQSADSYIVGLWNEELDGKLELKPTHVMRVETNDMECGSGSIVYDNAVYPSDSPGRESTLQQCRGDATSMQVAWHYNAKLTAGDYTCLYADGMLYDKLSVSLSDPKIDGYSKVNDALYAATAFTDIRPVSGTFEDVQESLVANFLFDSDGSDELISVSPRVSGQQGIKPKLLPVGTVREIKTCTGGNGGLCLAAMTSSSIGSNQYGYEYTSDEVFADDMAMSAWIYRKCGAASAPDFRRTSIAYFTGENGGMSHELRLYLDSSMALKLEYARDGVVSSTDSLTLSGLTCDKWHYVGFSLNKRDKMVLFANPTGAVDDMSDTSTFKTAQSMDPDTPRKLLSVMRKFEMLGAVDVEFDDVRVYRGQVSRATFLDAYRCGHRPLCAKRAHATPASRRVVCASAVIATKSEETYSDYFCTAAMYYDGAAIDVSAMLDTSGVTFTYRDTSWEESSFEMLRKPVGREFSSASYETIIQMDGDLKGCVNKFSSISYLDREAGNKPNLEWYYKVRTKMASASSSDLVSTTHYFKAPWIGTLEGTITAGSSGTPVAHVRVCADFAWPNGTAMSSSALDESSGDLALYMRTEHSSDMTRTASEKTYVVTDGDPDPKSGSSSLSPGEYVRVELARWSSIERVEVCVSGQVSSSQRLRAYVQDYDSGDSGNHGHECTFNAKLTTSHARYTCMFYDCVGSTLASFHGKFVNVVYDEMSSSDSDSSTVSVSEISAVGTRTNCRFSAVSDADGAYEIKLRDTSGKIPVKAKILGAAYKEEIFPKMVKNVIDSADTSSPTSQPAKVLLVVRQSDSESSVAASSLGQSPNSFESWDGDNSTSLSFGEFAKFVEDAAGFPLKGHAIISRAVWSSLDANGDDALSSSEFNNAKAKMRSGELVADPVLVYASINAKYLDSFETTRGDAHSCENFVLARTDSTAMPANTTAWNALYETLLPSGSSSLSSAITPCASGALVPAVYAGGEINMTKLIPLRVFESTSSRSVSLASASSNSEDDLTQFDGPVVLSATEQYHDIVHIFDKTQEPKSKDASQVFEHTFSDLSDVEDNVFDIRHRSEMQRNFADETAAIVRGAVLFPKDWTAGSTTCGLFEATIEVSELNQQGEPEKFTTDESGWFEMALTRGKSYIFNATFPKHTICYTGRTIADAADAINCDGASQTVTLNRLGDGNYIFFTDVTQGNIDLGVYHGQCESQYSGARFKVTPINGCHSPVFITSEQVVGWMTNVEGLPEGKFDDESNPLPDNARVWPFAAMDYSILLDSGPSVGGIGDLIADKTWKDGCATEDGDMVTFFRRRNALERLALMRDDNDWQEIRYKYHGYICVDIPDAYIPKIDNNDEKCYDPAEPNGGLTSKHFLGTSTSQENPLSGLLSVEKSIRMKVFELHVMPDGTYTTCFEKLPSKDKGTGSTQVKVRQDVSNAEDSECHPDRGGGASCDFQVSIDADGYLEFPDSEPQMTISAGFPNLAGNHRRTVRVEVERNDLYRSVTAIAIRELIPLGAKPRGGDGLSDDTFWATVPLDGLVYSVVHDPPGGNSYAELLSGTDFRIEYEITGMRAMTVKAGTYLDSQFGFEGKGEFGMNFGYTAEASGKLVDFDTNVGGQGVAVVDGPNFKVESTMANGWDIVMTTDRAVRSSQDPALPGRAGDTILGGGIELVYKMSDIVDLSDPNGDRVCLDVQAQITWLPRKPTSYVFAVHAIEAQILPNLQFLLKTVTSPGGVSDIDQSGKPDSVSWEDYLNRKIASWERTLAWSSPEDVSNIAAPFTSDESVYGVELKNKMDGDGGYNELFNAESDFSSVATALATEWTVGMGIDLAQATPMFALAIALASSGLMFPGSVPLLIFQTSLLGPSAYIQEARILPYIRADFDDTPVEGSENEGNIAYTSSSIVHPQARSADGNPEFDDKLRDTEGEVFYSFGMSDRAASDMDSWSSGAMKFDGTSADVSEDAASALEAIDKSRILASLTGGTGPQGMANGDDSNPPDSEILLSFSGGGHALEFTFKSDDEIEDYNSHVAFEIDGEVSFSGGYHQDGGVTAGSVGVYWDDNAGVTYGWNRDFRHDRMFIWSKRGHVVTKYSLADPEFGDKFVISVSSDKRFGTPVFSTKGGRSMCPGELGTVFRESSVYTEIPLKTKMNTENLNPGQRAMFELVIKNESPYREPGKFALRLVDGLQSSINAIVAAAYAKAGESEHVTAADVVEEVTKVAQSTIAKDSRDVSRLKTAASDASNRGDTAQSVADAVHSASTTAPREATELGDSMFRINGERLSLGDYMPLKFIGGDALSRQKSVSQMYLNLAIEPGFATRRIDYLQLRLQSLCETKMWEGANLYREPISYTQNVDPMSWSQPCPKVQFDESTISKYLYSSQSPSTSGELNLKVNNPDQYVLWPDEKVSDALMNGRLKLVRLQYRPVSGGEWITAKDEGSPETDKKFNLLCADSRTEGCKFDWVVNNQFEKLLSGFKDNVYELRLKNFCFGGPSLADPSVHEFVGDQRLTLTVDTKRPLDIVDFSSQQRVFGKEFDEDIDCGAQKVEVVKVRTECGASGGSATNVRISEEALRGTFEFKCTNVHGARWMVEFPENERGRYVVKVDGVTDAAGNAARSFELTVDAHCSLASSSMSDGAALLGARDRNAPSSAKSGDFAIGWRDVKASVSMGTVASFVVVVGAAVVALRRRRDGHADAQMESNKPLYDKGQHGAGGYGAAL